MLTLPTNPKIVNPPLVAIIPCYSCYGYFHLQILLKLGYCYSNSQNCLTFILGHTCIYFHIFFLKHTLRYKSTCFFFLQCCNSLFITINILTLISLHENKIPSLHTIGLTPHIPQYCYPNKL